MAYSDGSTSLSATALDAGTLHSTPSVGRELLDELTRNGIVRLPPLVSGVHLGQMQRAFEARLRRLRWNNVDGYEKTEPYRHMVEDVLTVDQGFVDVALHPVVKAVLRSYLGEAFQLVEAKGWKSIPTRRDFHGWHGDAWYDQATIQDIPREVKLAMYLTDVRSGPFNYVIGSHRQQHPRPYRNTELDSIEREQIVEVTGPAGSAFLFDTSGIHRQGVPMLEARQAIFLNYHDPSTPLQKEDRDYYRYHPLLLNAAFLGGLSEEDCRVLGFGDTRRYVPAFERRSGHEVFASATRVAFNRLVHIASLMERLRARLKATRG